MGSVDGSLATLPRAELRVSREHRHPYNHTIMTQPHNTTMIRRIPLVTFREVPYGNG